MRPDGTMRARSEADTCGGRWRRLCRHCGCSMNTAPVHCGCRTWHPPPLWPRAAPRLARSERLAPQRREPRRPPDVARSGGAGEQDKPARDMDITSKGMCSVRARPCCGNHVWEDAGRNDLKVSDELLVAPKSRWVLHRSHLRQPRHSFGPAAGVSRIARGASARGDGQHAANCSVVATHRTPLRRAFVLQAVNG